MATRWRYVGNLLRKWKVAVVFPVGMGSGLLPCPIEMLPPEELIVELVQAPQNELQNDGFPFFTLFRMSEL